MTTHFYGNKDDGYTAENYVPGTGTVRCTVVKTAAGWVATYYGSVERNPWERGSDGYVSRSCTPPTLTVEGAFPTRLAAAKAGWAACRAEEATYRRA